MGVFGNELIAILRYLLPGFLAAWVFYSFTAHEKSSQFERIVQAVIFTIVVQSIVSIFELAGAIGKEDKAQQFRDMLSFAVALFIGFSFALFANKDWFHGLLRLLKFTKQTSFPSEWFGVFNKTQSYIVLHLIDERRLYGWPKEWPQSDEKGHFYLIEASWLDIEEGETYLGSGGVEGVLMPVSSVRWVEFMNKMENTNG
jgi:hypothetical protein